MQVSVQIPDDIGRLIQAPDRDLARVTLESVALEAVRAGRITEVQLRKMLGLSRIELDGFLKAHGIYQEYTLQEFEEERQALKELGF